MEQRTCVEAPPHALLHDVLADVAGGAEHDHALPGDLQRTRRQERCEQSDEESRCGDHGCSLAPTVEDLVLYLAVSSRIAPSRILSVVPSLKQSSLSRIYGELGGGGEEVAFESRQDVLNLELATCSTLNWA